MMSSMLCALMLCFADALPSRPALRMRSQAMPSFLRDTRHVRVVSCANGSSPNTWKSQLPNCLTASRVVALPVLAASFYSAQAAARRVPAIIFIAIALTDWLDGSLARRW